MRTITLTRPNTIIRLAESPTGGDIDISIEGAISLDIEARRDDCYASIGKGGRPVLIAGGAAIYITTAERDLLRDLFPVDF